MFAIVSLFLNLPQFLLLFAVPPPCGVFLTFTVGNAFKFKFCTSQKVTLTMQLVLVRHFFLTSKRN